jgi:8-oxo-dGTP pyrophosphatase MutT (NUDIX family)
MIDTQLVHILLWQGKQILSGLCKNTAYGNRMYSLPGGKREVHESPTEAISREALEELGIELDQKNLEYSSTSYYRDDQRSFINFFFSCSKWNDVIGNKEDTKCAGLEWFDIGRLPQNTILFVRKAIVRMGSGKHYHETRK